MSIARGGAYNTWAGKTRHTIMEISGTIRRAHCRLDDDAVTVKATVGKSVRCARAQAYSVSTFTLPVANAVG